MQITPYGYFTYLVQSETTQDQYLVDLLYNHGNGACDCPQFRIRLASRITPTERKHCKHITAARAFCIEEIITALAKSEQNQSEDGP